MNRMSEIILGVIGILLYVFFMAASVFWVWVLNHYDVLEGIFDEVFQTAWQEDTIPINELVGVLSGGGWVLIGVSVISIVLGIVCLFLIKGNKGGSIAGVLFLVTAFLSTAVSFGVFAIAGLFYVIAGIMCLYKNSSKKNPYSNTDVV
ncbi:DUF4064 domain-containing protein [Ornithinibacillus contaminans]|uniref:DUF4064 domain-containing protein n=1 Tax=Ornithinibacillus contaminans TaxID=694055 RepID=UPI00064DCECC|nr:DUF4064 domain-containing protein [Ornithinibacillus contaminans]